MKKSRSKTIKVSIIVPVYNAENTISRCIESIIKQKYQDFELILVDDGSKDNSGNICDEYALKDQRIKVIHKDNSGVSDTRNIAINNALGEYVEFLDADDWLAPFSTKLLVESAEKNNCEMVVADFYRVANDKVAHKGAIHEEGVLSQEEFASLMMENPADYYYGVLWNKIYRKDIIDKHHIQMNKNINWCEDFIFNLEYLRFCKHIYALPVPIYYYVKTKGSLVNSSLNISKIIKMKMMVFEWYHDFFKEIFTEEEYEKKKIQLYRFLIDYASDDAIVSLNTKKLGHERLLINTIEVKENNILTDMYYIRKTLDSIVEPIAIKHQLSMDEIDVLMHLACFPNYKTMKELADFINIPTLFLSTIIYKLSLKKILNINIISPSKFDFTFTTNGKAIILELEKIYLQFNSVVMKDLSNDEIKIYHKIIETIRNNDGL